VQLGRATKRKILGKFFFPDVNVKIKEGDNFNSRQINKLVIFAAKAKLVVQIRKEYN
jgi:hypothetical protein